MQLIASPLPQSTLARNSRRSPPAILSVEQPVTICDLDNPETATATTPATVAPVETADSDLHSTVPRRFMREGRWKDIARVRDEMMKAALAKHMPKADARAWCYAELDRLYPPLPPPKLTNLPADDSNDDAGVSSSPLTSDAAADTETAAASSNEPRARGADSSELAVSVTERVTSLPQLAPESSRLQGLGDVPATWLPLPANAALAAEIGWVQANRLYVVEERGNTIIVHLDRANEPAPSRAAIGWLETSIRSYAKYVDVVGKYLGVESDEASVVRRERMAIAEIRSLLDEMHVD